MQGPHSTAARRRPLVTSVQPPTARLISIPGIHRAAQLSQRMKLAWPFAAAFSNASRHREHRASGAGAVSTESLLVELVKAIEFIAHAAIFDHVFTGLIFAQQSR